MVAKRIIPCLDIRDGRTVKGTSFVNMRDMGDPIELACRYDQAGADELVFLDISATDEGRATTLDLVKQVARCLSIPFTVGGGISSINHVSALLNCGADKVSINSAAVRSPQLIDSLAREFGSQCIVVAIDSRRGSDRDEVVIQSGKAPTGLTTQSWAREVMNRGAGEILLTSINHDGARTGFALELTRSVEEAVTIPVIASGGGGHPDHFLEVLTIGSADAALAAGIFHAGELEIGELKRYLELRGVEVRR